MHVPNLPKNVVDCFKINLYLDAEWMRLPGKYKLLQLKYKLDRLKEQGILSK